MKIIAIDPGNIESAWLVYSDGDILEFGKVPNEELLDKLGYLNSRLQLEDYHLAIEMIASYGMPVGASVFDTCVWIGRFVQKFGGNYTYVYRKDVKIHLCGSMKAKDGNIRQALLDRHGAQGTKKDPGKTYGISKDVWSALAIATYLYDVGF